MSQVIVFEAVAGNVAVCIPTGELSIQEVLEKDCPKHAFIIDQSKLPNQDNDFFDAWEMDAKSVSVNLDKAKELTKRRLRAEREPLLAAQDVAFQRALETGADTTAIVAEKERLRDITKFVDLCGTTSELRNLKCNYVPPVEDEVVVEPVAGV